MKFTVKKEVLVDAFAKIGKVLSNKTTIPVLRGVKVEARADCILLTASDASESIIHRIPADPGKAVIELEGGAVFKREALEVVSKLSGDITYELEENTLHVTQAKTKLDFSTMPATDFPKIPTTNSKPISLTGQQFSDLIARTVYAVSKSEVRPVLTGVNLSFGKELQAVSTDSHRLSKVTIPLETEMEEICITVPGKMLEHALKAFDLSQNVFLTAEQNQIAMVNGNTLYLSRLIDGQYPATDRLIPTDFKHEMTASTEELKDTLTLLATLSKEGVVKMEVDGMFVKFQSRSETSKGEREIAYHEYTGEEGFAISYSTVFLLDALKRVESDSVKLKFVDPMRPFIVEGLDGTDQTQLILPVRTY